MRPALAVVLARLEARRWPSAAELLERRERARAARDWATSDRLREELAALGVKVADTPQGQKVVPG